MKETNLTARRKSRHNGIDLLRVLSTLMVLILHILGYGGVLGNLEPGSVKFTAAWILESSAYCAVNCYALISGYVGVRGTYRYSQLAVLWLQVVLYILLGNLIFAVCIPGSAGLKDILKSFFPILKNHFWYFTAYAFMFLLVPVLNRAIASLNRKQAAVLCWTVFIVFSVLPTFLRVDGVFFLGSGYSVLWLTLLYVVGGCFQKHGFLHRLSGGLLALGLLFCVALMVASKTFISLTSSALIRDNISSDILISYTAPTVFAFAVILLALCGKHPRLPGWVEKGLSVLAPVSFGVCVIHAHPLIYTYFSKGAFEPYAFYSTAGMIGAVLLTAVVVYLACTVIDTLRIRLFRALKLRQRLQRLEEKWIGALWDSPN